MGKSLIKITDSILEALTNYNVTDDFRIDADLIKQKVLDFRASIIYDELRAGAVDDSYYQRYVVGLSECVSDQITIGNHTFDLKPSYRQVIFPSLIAGKISYFGSADFKIRFTRRSLLQFLTSEGSRYTGGSPMFTVIGNTAFVKNLPSAGNKVFMMVGIFLDPRDVDLDEESDFPVPDASKLELLVKRDILSTYQINLDVLNNTKDEALALGKSSGTDTNQA